MGDEKRKAAYEDEGIPKVVPLKVMLGIAAVVVALPFALKLLHKDGGTGNKRSSKKPSNLADLRAIRAKAAESRRVNPQSAEKPDPFSQLTPLGMALHLTKQVDALESDVNEVFQAFEKANGVQSASVAKDFLRLSEELTRVQLKIDGIQGDESARPVKRQQSRRIQGILDRLESVTSSV